jgi:hypothetical protein
LLADFASTKELADGGEKMEPGERPRSLTTWEPSSSTSGGPPDIDEELVHLAQAGDDVAFEKLYVHYHDRICCSLSHMLGDERAGWELAQETFCKAWEA